MKKLLLITLTLFMILTSALSPLARTIKAEDEETEEVEVIEETSEVLDGSYGTISGYWVNPEYEGLIDPSAFETSSSDIQSFDLNNAVPVNQYLLWDDAIEKFEEHLKNRDQEFSIYIATDSLDGIDDSIIKVAYERDLLTSNAGDYIKHHLLSWGYTGSYSYSNQYNVKINITVAYLDNTQQERAVAAELERIYREEFNFDEHTTRYEKIKTIYNYITTHVRYDYENLNDDTYLLKYSAYAALIDHTAVCQGYATLLYRMLLDNGIEARVITGMNHAWNIAKVDDYWYSLDSTWDESVTGGYSKPRTNYFLKGTDYFYKTHTPYDPPKYAYLTQEFIAKHPQNTKNYYTLEDIWIKNKIAEIAPGDVHQYEIDANGREKYLVLWSSDPSVADITPNGKLIAYKDGNAKIYFKFDELTCVENITVKTPTNPSEYTVVFDWNYGNGGTVSSIVATASHPFVMPENGFVKDGYRFIGWNADADGFGTTYQPGDSVTLNPEAGSTVVFYACGKSFLNTRFPLIGTMAIVVKSQALMLMKD